MSDEALHGRAEVSERRRRKRMNVQRRRVFKRPRLRSSHAAGGAAGVLLAPSTAATRMRCRCSPPQAVAVASAASSAMSEQVGDAGCASGRDETRVRCVTDHGRAGCERGAGVAVCCLTDGDHAFERCGFHASFVEASHLLAHALRIPPCRRRSTTPRVRLCVAEAPRRSALLATCAAPSLNNARAALHPWRRRTLPPPQARTPHARRRCQVVRYVRYERR